ncbi:MAG TPA: hypothetical protein VFH91_09090 [Pyrinomonadaceae bacterium]|nr:hypothetical protein [Pyrinomonadaceae bacterium]
MLPPRLTHIKQSLEAKSSSKRTTSEDQLLDELRLLDDSAELRRFLLTESRVMKMTSGPTAFCACCGR